MYGYFPGNLVFSQAPYGVYYYSSNLPQVNPEQMVFTFNPTYQQVQRHFSIQDQNYIQPVVQQESPKKRTDIREQVSDRIQGFKQPSRKQVEGRNIHSNIFRSFLKYLLSEFFLKHEFTLICKKYSLGISEDQFKSKVRVISQSFKNYIKRKQVIQFIEKIMKNKLCEDDHQIFRIMLDKYCKNIHIMAAYNSKKVQNRSMKFHMEQLRFLRQQIHQIKNSLKYNRASK